MRYLYTFLFYLSLPWILVRLLWRGRQEPAYRQRLFERIGCYSFTLERCIWIHAVSLGEVMAAIPLIQLLQKKYPELPILVTTMTPTGMIRVKATFGERVQHAYLPYDLPDAVRRFLRNMRPVIAIMMETELWPNLFAALRAKHIPICLLNARLSARSARRYEFVAKAMREMLACVTLIAANSAADARRFIDLGANEKNVVVTGNIKFDLEIPDTLAEASQLLRQRLGEQRFIWIAASTHEGEEEIMLEAHHAVRQHYPNALLILVPRHPGRFEKIAQLCRERFNTVRRSEKNTVLDYQNAAVFLGDSMGELMLYYSVADVAFVGGSLVTRGGHNFVEPAVLNKAIIVGPHVFNFTQMVGLFMEEEALLQVQDEMELIAALIILANDVSQRETLAKRARVVVEANRGALAKQLELVSKLL